MDTPFFLERLGLDATADERDVRRAYARELKKIDQEQDPAGFQRLRECYELAQSWTRYNQDYEDEDDIAVPEHKPAVVSSPTGWENTAPTAFPPQESAGNREAEATLAHIEPIEEQTQQGEAPLRPVTHYAEPKMSDAQIVVADFMPRLYAAAQSSSKPTLESLREGLKRCLADPRMVSLDAGVEFEHIIAHTLAQGWKPGHETLFVAALFEFDWEQDIRRLQRLDYAGGFLSHAVAERQHFFQQEHDAMEAQRKVIGMLRQSARPINADLIKYLPLVEGLIQRYPHMLAIIAGREQAEQWLRWSAEVPEAVRKKIIQVTMQQPPQPKRSGRGSYWWIGIAIYAAIQALHVLSSSH